MPVRTLNQDFFKAWSGDWHIFLAFLPRIKGIPRNPVEKTKRSSGSKRKVYFLEIERRIRARIQSTR